MFYQFLDLFQNSLSIKSVYNLIYIQDWLRGQLRVLVVSIEKDLCDVKKFDKGEICMFIHFLIFIYPLISN